LLKKQQKRGSMSSDNVFNFIKQNVSIKEVIEQHFKLDKDEAFFYYGYCPFHKEKIKNEPKEFCVNVTKKCYYCFVCNETGDVISFKAKILDITLNEAAEILLKDFNLNYEKPKKIILRVKNG
jgi:DNA primase